MKKVILLFLLMVACASQFLVAQKSVHCLVLDKTLSMTGHGGTDIWADVQSYCCEWTDGVSVPSTVLLYTFDKNLVGPQVFEINSDNDKAKVKEALKNVKVDGRFTYIASNLGKAVQYVYDNYPSKDVNKRIYLVTDGIEEEQGSDFMGVLKKYEGWRGDYDYLYYVDLRGLAPKEVVDALDSIKGGEIGKGFVQFVSAKPLFASVNCVLGESQSIEQQFIVSNEALFEEMSFDVRIDSVLKLDPENSNQPNPVITPSRDIKGGDMEKIEDAKYKTNFILSFINDSECECDVYVSLTERDNGEKKLAIEPKGFCIKARNKVLVKPVVRVKKKKGLED